MRKRPSASVTAPVTSVESAVRQTAMVAVPMGSAVAASCTAPAISPAKAGRPCAAASQAMSERTRSRSPRPLSRVTRTDRSVISVGETERTEIGERGAGRLRAERRDGQGAAYRNPTLESCPPPCDRLDISSPLRQNAGTLRPLRLRTALDATARCVIPPRPHEDSVRPRPTPEPSTPPHRCPSLGTRSGPALRSSSTPSLSSRAKPRDLAGSALLDFHGEIPRLRFASLGMTEWVV